MQFQPLNNQRGVAMLMAIMTALLLGILAAELVYDTEVYHRMVFNQVDELRAQYLAKSGLRLAILQLVAKQKAADKVKSLGLSGDTDTLTDKIWQTPLVLPPPAPPSLGPAAKESLASFTKELNLQGQITILISGESSKLNLNQLVWLNPVATPAQKTAQPGQATPPPVPATPQTPEQQQQSLQAIRTAFAATLDQLIQNKKLEDEVFKRKYASLNATVLMENLIAWMDPNTKDDGDHHSKEDYYARATPYPYSIKNAPLSSISELHMVKGFDDEVFKLLGDNFTTLITTGININQVPIALLRGLIPGLTLEDAEKVDKRRTDPTLGGAFSSASDFWTYLNTLGSFQDTQQKLTASGITFVTTESAYRVTVSASSGFAQKTWVALVGAAPPDTSGTQTQPSTQGNQPVPQPGTSTSPGTTPPAATNSNQLPNIIYLKTD